MKSELIEIDAETLEILNKYDISEFGDSPADSALMLDSKLYITLPYKNNSANDSLTVFDTETKEFNNIKLPEVNPSQLLLYHNNIIISHVDNVLNKGNSLSILDTQTGKIMHYRLKNTPRQICIKDNYLYSVDFKERNVCKYIFEDNKINFAGQFSVEKRNEKEFYFLSGCFCR